MKHITSRDIKVGDYLLCYQQSAELVIYSRCTGIERYDEYSDRYSFFVRDFLVASRRESGILKVVDDDKQGISS